MKRLAIFIFFLFSFFACSKNYSKHILKVKKNSHNTQQNHFDIEFNSPSSILKEKMGLKEKGLILFYISYDEGVFIIDSLKMTCKQELDIKKVQKTLSKEMDFKITEIYHKLPKEKHSFKYIFKLTNE